MAGKEGGWGKRNTIGGEEEHTLGLDGVAGDGGSKLRRGVTRGPKQVMCHMPHEHHQFMCHMSHTHQLSTAIHCGQRSQQLPATQRAHARTFRMYSYVPAILYLSLQIALAVQAFDIRSLGSDDVCVGYSPRALEIIDATMRFERPPDGASWGRGVGFGVWGLGVWGLRFGGLRTLDQRVLALLPQRFLGGEPEGVGVRVV